MLQKLSVSRADYSLDAVCLFENAFLVFFLCDDRMWTLNLSLLKNLWLQYGHANWGSLSPHCSWWRRRFFMQENVCAHILHSINDSTLVIRSVGNFDMQISLSKVAWRMPSFESGAATAWDRSAGQNVRHTCFSLKKLRIWRRFNNVNLDVNSFDINSMQDISDGLRGILGTGRVVPSFD